MLQPKITDFLIAYIKVVKKILPFEIYNITDDSLKNVIGGKSDFGIGIRVGYRWDGKQ